MHEPRPRPAPLRLILPLLVLLAPALLGAAPRPKAPAKDAAAPPAVAAPPADAPANRIFLTANAPFGAPRASDTLAAACGDTTRRDTLWLCFEPAADETTMYGFSAEVFVYAPPGDTLGSYWAMERGGANNGGLTVTFGPDESFPQPQPWTTQGIGTALYDRTPQSGRFRFLYVMPMGKAGPVKAGTRYVLGRILLGAKHGGLTGCEQPVCIEWHTATVQYRAGEKTVVEKHGSRWVSRGGAAGECRDRIPAWRPRR